jgi:predicted dehydrogenase
MAIRALVVGAGSRGRDWIREIRQAPAYDLAGCVDSNPVALAGLTQTQGVATNLCFTNTEEALEKTKCDCVIVATPVEDHSATCELALMRDRGVMVEKPFTMNLLDAVRVVSLAERRQKTLMIAQNYRYLRAFRAARRLISEGRLGRIGMMTLQYFRVPHEMRASLAALTNSMLLGMGIHHLDLMRYLARDEVNAVMADGFTLPWGKLPPGASFRVMLTFAGGTQALYSATYESSGHEFLEGGQEFYARFTGEKATLHVMYRRLILCEQGKWPRLISRGKREFTEERILLGQFERSLKGEEEAETSGRDNLQTMAILEACQRSAAGRTWIDPQELLRESREQSFSAGHRP